MSEKIITATTFQLTPLGTSLKALYEIGDRVNSPCGTGVITELDGLTGNCKLKINYVYLVIEEIDYMGDAIIAVYENECDAENYCKNHRGKLVVKEFEVR